MHMQNLVRFYQFVPKILCGNKIPTSMKGHNSVINLRKLMCNNPKLDVFNINAYTQFGQILSIFLKILSCNEILTSIKGHNAVINK